MTEEQKKCMNDYIKWVQRNCDIMNHMFERFYKNKETVFSDPEDIACLRRFTNILEEHNMILVDMPNGVKIGFKHGK